MLEEETSTFYLIHIGMTIEFCNLGQCSLDMVGNAFPLGLLLIIPTRVLVVSAESLRILSN